MSSRINYTPSSELHVALVQKWIDEGLTPETQPLMAGLVKEIEVTQSFEVPGRRFQPSRRIVKQLTPDRVAIARKVLMNTLKREEAKAAAAQPPVSRMDFIELDQWGSYCS